LVKTEDPLPSTSAKGSKVLLGGAVGMSILCVPVLVLAMILGGLPQLGSAGLIIITVALYFVIGQVVERLALGLADYSGLMWVLLGYVVRVGILGALLYWWLGHPESSAWVDKTWFFIGGAAAVMGWLGGLMWAQLKSRQQVYDKEYVAPKDWQERP
jgi:hypothetical protein